MYGVSDTSTSAITECHGVSHVAGYISAITECGVIVAGYVGIKCRKTNSSVTSSCGVGSEDGSADSGIVITRGVGIKGECADSGIATACAIKCKCVMPISGVVTTGSAIF